MTMLTTYCIIPFYTLFISSCILPIDECARSITIINDVTVVHCMRCVREILLVLKLPNIAICYYIIQLAFVRVFCASVHAHGRLSGRTLLRGLLSLVFKSSTEQLRYYSTQCVSLPQRLRLITQTQRQFNSAVATRILCISTIFRTNSEPTKQSSLNIRETEPNPSPGSIADDLRSPPRKQA